MKWILVFMLASDNPNTMSKVPITAVSIEFNSRQACIDAGVLFSREANGRVVLNACTPKGKE